MRKIIVAAAFALGACTPPVEEAPAPTVEAIAIEAPSGEYALDKTHASLTIRANHLGLSHYTLRFTDLDATLNFNAEDPAQSTLVASAATASIETDFVGPKDFDAELQNSEWLDAANHPAITFRSTSIERTGPNSGRMSGDLTIKGQTHPAVFDIEYNQSYAQHPFGLPLSLIGFSARGTIRRSEFGVSTFLPAAGTAIGVGDEVEVIIEAEFTRPVEATPAANPAPAN
jgi:polyisoprenoid-binding protein YceI